MEVKQPLQTRAQRWNAALSGVLLVALVVLVNVWARGLDARLDVSEDQLFAPSPELQQRLAELDDLLVVTAYFTARPEHGAVQIAKSRLVAQLEDWADVSGGRMRVDFLDPNSSSAAKLEAVRLGIQPFPSTTLVGGGASAYQEVWFGLSLEYRGRERAIPLAMPQTLEYAFASELYRLTRARVPRIGLYAPADSSGGVGWGAARQTLAQAGEVVGIEHLSTEDALPGDLDLLVVVGPRELHPRAAYTIDQFVQGGGRVVIALEQHEYRLDGSPARSYYTGLEDLLVAWGLELTRDVVFDKQCVEISLQRRVDGRTLGTVDLAYPFWPRIDADGLARDLPVTARLGGLSMRWAQALRATQAPPDELERIDMVVSSEDAYLCRPPSNFITESAWLDTESAQLAATQTPGRRPLAVSLTGSFPSPFEAAPEAQELFQAIVGGAGAAPGTTDEPVLSETGAGHAVVFADTDWLRPRSAGQRWDPAHEALLLNLADWLLLEEDLVALRSRFPKPRPLTNFLAEERAERGVTGLGNVVGLDEAESRTAAEDAAEDAALARRRNVMLLSLGGSVALALLVFGLPGWLRRQRASPYAPGGPLAPAPPGPPPNPPSAYSRSDTTRPPVAAVKAADEATEEARRRALEDDADGSADSDDVAEDAR